MIAQFENGFITKSKLNEMVDGINTSVADTTSINSILSNIVILNSNITKTVGVGGDFATLSQAFEWCSRVVSTKYRVSLVILTGFNITEQIKLENVDFGFVDISAQVKSDYINVDTLGFTLKCLDNSLHYAFWFKNSISPVFKSTIHLITHVSQGVLTIEPIGIYAEENSIVRFADAKGIIYLNIGECYKNTIFINTGSKLFAKKFSMSISHTGLRVENNSYAEVSGMNTWANKFCIIARNGSVINAKGSSISVPNADINTIIDISC